MKIKLNILERLNKRESLKTFLPKLGKGCKPEKTEKKGLNNPENCTFRLAGQCL